MPDKIATITPTVFYGRNAYGYNVSAAMVTGLYWDKLNLDLDTVQFGVAPWFGAGFDIYSSVGELENRKLASAAGLNTFLLSKGSYGYLTGFGAALSAGITIGQNLNQKRTEVGFRSYLNLGASVVGAGPALAIEDFRDPVKTLFFGFQVHINVPICLGLE